MSFVKFDPDSPNHMVVIEDKEYQSYNGYKVGDKVYSIYGHYGFEPFTIIRLLTYGDIEIFEVSIQNDTQKQNIFGLQSITFKIEDFEKCFITEKEQRRRKLEKINKNIC